MSSSYSLDMCVKMKKIRKALNLTQKDFAEKLGFKQSFYSLIESGRAGMPLHKMPILFTELNVSEKWFFASDEFDDTYMFDTKGENMYSNINGYTHEQIHALYEDSENDVLEIPSPKNDIDSLIEEKNNRIEDLKEMISTKNQIINLLYAEIDRLKNELSHNE